MSEFHTTLPTVLHNRIPAFAEESRGEYQYLTSDERDNFAKSEIGKILSSQKDGKISYGNGWYLEYYENQYLSESTLEQFNQRWSDVWDNLTTISSDNKISAQSLEITTIDRDSYWIRRFSHLLAESQFRGGIARKAKQGSWPISIGESLGKLTSILEQHWDKDYVFKFGDKEHLLGTLNRGIIRVAPASSYDDPSLNFAQRDDENEVSFLVKKKHLPDEFLQNRPQMNSKSGLVEMRVQDPTPYFVWCASSKYRPEIAISFGYEYVLVIQDKKRFVRVLKNKAAEFGFADIAFSRISYFDPYLDFDAHLDVRNSKHHRYQYQHEIRLTASPSSDIQLNNPIFLELGPMNDFCYIAKVFTRT